MKSFLILLLFVLSCTGLYAQLAPKTSKVKKHPKAVERTQQKAISIEGTVRNLKYDPLEGVLVENTKSLQRTVTDSFGDFRIKISQGDNLRFSKKGISTEIIDPFSRQFTDGKDIEIEIRSDSLFPPDILTSAPPPPPPPPPRHLRLLLPALSPNHCTD